MTEWIRAFTSLPNLHPAVVHFPIVLAPVATLFDLAAATLPKQRSWAARAAVAVWALAGLGAGAAYWAGEAAEESLTGVPAPVLASIDHHADWALYTVWSFAVVALLRLGLAWARPAWVGRSASALFAAVGLAASGLVAYTADLGGGLVYGQGVAVDLAGEAAREPVRAPLDESLRSAGTPADRLAHADDGTVTWRPVATDGEALGSLLVPAPGASLDPVAVVAGDDGAPGLRLRISGRTLLVLPGTFSEVQVAATLVPDTFRGTLGLAHHVRGADAAGLFTVTVPEGGFTLGARSSGGDEVLGEASRPLPSGPLELVLYAAGRHRRGSLGSEVLVHAHTAPLAEGAAGLLFDGEGEVRIVAFEIAPAVR
jgi:uncharacterized membrane protein